MERREAISLLREMLEACHGTIAPYMIDVRPQRNGKSKSDSTLDELLIRVSLTDSARALLKRIAAKRGLKMSQSGDLIRIYKDMDMVQLEIIAN